MAHDRGGDEDDNGASPGLVIVGEQERPRLLVIGFDDDLGLLERICRLAPTVRTVDHLRSVNQAEYDLLITDRFESPWSVPNMPARSTVSVARHLSVVYRSDGVGRGFEKVHQRIGVIAGEFAYPADLPPAVKTLIETDLLPAASAAHSAGQTHRWFQSQPSAADTNPAVLSGHPGGPALHSFLQTRQGHVLAGWYERSERSECWLLPKETADVVGWVAAALDHLHQRDPEHYPARPGWADQWAWRTLPERRLLDQLTAVADERAQLLERLATREASIRSDLDVARGTADAYERGLLNAQGDGLVELVIRALTELGFEVTDMDQMVPGGSPRYEDLQITDPSADGWVALGEIKGYSGSGGKTGDLTKMARFATHYVQEHTHLPSAEWYLVNHFLERDPDRRPDPLAGATDDVASFAEDGGLVWSTIQLFSLLMAVRATRVDATEVRALLRETTGRLKIPDEWRDGP